MPTTTSRNALFSVIAGVVCGAVLILITIASRNGLLMYLPYIGLAIASIFYMRRQPLSSFVSRFGTAFTAYAIATLIIALYINMFVDPRVLRPLTLRSVAGPAAAMIVIGAIGSAIVALLGHSGHVNATAVVER